MKIEKLYTSSQLVEILRNKVVNENLDAFEALDTAYKYGNFLKQPRKKEMFVCEVEEPERFNYDINHVGQVKYNDALNYYEQAQKKVIFEGWKERKWDGGIVFDNHELDIFIDIEEHKSLCDLAEETKGELKLKNVEL